MRIVFHIDKKREGLSGHAAPPLISAAAGWVLQRGTMENKKRQLGAGAMVSKQML